MIRTGIIQFLIFIVVLVAVFAFYGQRTRGLVRAPSSPAPTSSISRASAGVKEGYNEASTGERAYTIKRKGDEEKKPKKPGDVGKNEGTGSAKPEVLEKMRAWKRKQNAASNDCDTTITTSTTITMESEAMEGPRQMPTMYDMAMARSTTRERRDFIAGISRRKLCFHHIPKTGGTNFGLKKIFKVLFNWKELENGEMPLHIGPLLGPDVTYERMGHSGDPRGCIDGAVITILRDPKERYLSAYRNSKAIGKVCVLGSNKYEEQCACCGVKYSDLLAVGFKRDAVSVIDFLKPEIIEENQMAKMLLGEEVVSYCRDHHLDETCRSIIRHRLLSNYLLVRLVLHMIGCVFVLLYISY